MSCHCSINSSMITAQCYIHNMDNFEFLFGWALIHNNLFKCSSHSQNARLRWWNNSREIIYPIHSKIWNSECTSRELFRLKFIFSSSSRDILTSNAICSKPFKFAFFNVGAINPLSVWTANDILTLLYYLMKLSIQELFVAGTFTAANEDALITKSFTESFVFEYLFNFSLSFIKLST